MSQPLLNNVIDDGDRGEAEKDSALTSTMTAPATAPATVWKPVIIRVVLGGLALLGLAGVGAASMLAGLEGARANPPSSSAVRASSNGSAVASGAGSGLPSPPAPPGGAASNSPITAPTAAPDACTAGRTPDGKVILNLATVADLRTLPSIGPKRAEAILALREKLKKFHRVQELRRVRGIGAKTLQKLAPKIVIDPPPGTCPPSVEATAKKA